MAGTPRGLRLNNPMNIELGQPWAGLAPLQVDPRFCSFTSVPYGIRAGCKILQRYAGRKWDSVRAIVTHYAPPTENDTAAYIAALDAALPGGPDDHLNLADPLVLAATIKAIILHEQGVQPFGDAVINAGMALAGIAPAVVAE